MRRGCIVVKTSNSVLSERHDPVAPAGVIAKESRSLAVRKPSPKKRQRWTHRTLSLVCMHMYPLLRKPPEDVYLFGEVRAKRSAGRTRDSPRRFRECAAVVKGNSCNLCTWLGWGSGIPSLGRDHPQVCRSWSRSPRNPMSDHARGPFRTRAREVLQHTYKTWRERSSKRESARRGL